MTIFWFCSGLFVGMSILLTIGTYFGKKGRDAKSTETLLYESHFIRLYSHGHVLIGPVTLYDLAMIMKYGGYQETDGEKSFFAPFMAPNSIEITVEKRNA